MRFYTCTEHAHIADMQAALRAADNPTDRNECEALLALAGFPASLDYLIPQAVRSEQIRRSLFNMEAKHAASVYRRNLGMEAMENPPPDAAGIAHSARQIGTRSAQA